MNKYNLKEYNITFFLIVAIIIHLLLFVVKKHICVDTPKDREVLKIQVFQKKEGSSFGTPSKAPEKIVQPKKEIVKKETPKKEVVKKDVAKKEVKKETPITKSMVQSKEVIKEETKTSSSCGSSETSTSSSNIESSQQSGDGGSFGSNFTYSDGVYTANSAEGIEYKIIKEIEPDYPLQALKINYKKVVKVKAKFLVGLNGSVERVEIINSHKKLGFDDEVRKALYSWKFQPIYYKNKNIKVYFVKEFVFEIRN